MSFGEGNRAERIRELESRNKTLKEENARLRELAKWLAECPVPPRFTDSVRDRCRAEGIEVDHGPRDR